VVVSATFENIIYVIGVWLEGFESDLESLSSIVDVLDTTSGEWSSVSSIPFDVNDGGAVVINKKIYVIGKHSNKKNITYIYDIHSDVWLSSNSYNAPICQFSDIGVATVNDKIYLIGGNDINDNSQGLVQEGILSSDL